MLKIIKTFKKVFLAGSLIIPASIGFGADQPMQTHDTTLTEQLREKAEASKAKSPPEKQAIMEKNIDDIRKSQIVERALKKGDMMPSFELPDVKKGLIKSADLLKRGPLVVVFYRGGWCPYCNLQLHDLQKHLTEINSLGAELVTISPQTPDNSISTAEKAELAFYVLSDVGNNTARKFNLVYRVPDDLKELYKGFGLDLEKSNGSKEWELPLAATYVVSPQGKIIYSFVDADFKKRGETNDVIKVLGDFRAERNRKSK